MQNEDSIVAMEQPFAMVVVGSQIVRGFSLELLLQDEMKKAW
jgi:hypothetical protein